MVSRTRGGLLRSVDAVTVPVPDLDRGLGFYAVTLGQELIWRNDEVGQAGLRLPDGPSELVLSTRQRYEPNWLVDSVDRAVEVLRELGCAVIAGPHDIPVGRLAVVADPFGNALVLLDLSGGLYPEDLGPAPVHASLAEQTRWLDAALRTNAAVRAIFERTPTLELSDWFLGAGAVTQTVWNVRHGRDPGEGIKDYDLVYYDGEDLDAGTERIVQQRARALFHDLDVDLDVTNEARVHLWYHEDFGPRIDQHPSTEHAISTWPSTASSIGVRPEGGRLVVCAPFGLTDLLGMVVRPNKTLVSREIYEAKAQRWANQWPRLTVVPW